MGRNRQNGGSLKMMNHEFNECWPQQPTNHKLVLVIFFSFFKTSHACLEKKTPQKSPTHSHSTPSSPAPLPLPSLVRCCVVSLTTAATAIYANMAVLFPCAIRECRSPFSKMVAVASLRAKQCCHHHTCKSQPAAVAGSLYPKREATATIFAQMVVAAAREALAAVDKVRVGPWGRG